MNLADKILELRKKRGLSQEELADVLNVSRQTISRWEVGTALPDAINLVQLSKVFEVSTDYLLGRQDSIPSFLSEEERSIIDLYRKLDRRAKDNVTNTMIFESGRSNNVENRKP